MVDTFINNIETVLKANFKPEVVEVVDESYQHSGHAGFGIYSHLLIRISAKAFADVSRLQREKAVRKVIMDMAAQDIHSIRFEFI